MTWSEFTSLQLTTDWSYTPVVNDCRFFRLRNRDVPRLPIAWIAQAEILPTGEMQFFQMERVFGLVQYRVIELVKPAFFGDRRLAFRQETKTPNNWTVDIEVCDMPMYSLEDVAAVNPVATANKNKTTVAVTTTAVRVLAANPNRKSATFFNTDATRQIFLNTGGTVSSTAALAKIGAKSVYVTDINWTGEFWAVASAGTASLEVEEYT